MPNEPTSAEASAARHVATTLGGRWQIHDDGTSDGQYDFKIYVNKEIHALEVTSMNEPKQRELQNVASGSRPAPQLSRAWSVMPTKDARKRINRSIGGIAQVLTRLEELGLDELPTQQTLDEQVAELQIWAREKGVRFANALPSWEPGKIMINTDHGGWVTCSPDDAVAEIVGQVAWKEDNRKKLEKSAHKRRHLFVEIDPSWLDGFGALNTNPFLPPDAAPDLPHEITDLWLRSFERCWWWDGHEWLDAPQLS